MSIKIPKKTLERISNLPSEEDRALCKVLLDAMSVADDACGLTNASRDTAFRTAEIGLRALETWKEIRQQLAWVLEKGESNGNK